MKTMLSPLFWLVSLSLLHCSTAEFGDYVDPTFSCPAATTCVQVCVAVVDDCPDAMVCDDDRILCADGTCAAVCDADVETPCEFECAAVACPKVIDTYDQCKAKYGPWYDAEAKCGSIETMEETKLLHFNEPGYIAAYVWAGVVTAMIVLWCAFK